MKTIINIPDPIHKEIKEWNEKNPRSRIVIGWVCGDALEKEMKKRRDKKYERI